MEFMAHSGDFYRMLRDKVTMEIWKNQAAGREKFGYMVQAFLAEKKIRGGACASKLKFVEDLQRFLDSEAEVQIKSTKEEKINNGRFLQRLSKEVEQIAEEYKWFSEQIVWES